MKYKARIAISIFDNTIAVLKHSTLCMPIVWNDIQIHVVDRKWLFSGCFAVTDNLCS